MNTLVCLRHLWFGGELLLVRTYGFCKYVEIFLGLCEQHAFGGRVHLGVTLS